CSFKETEAYSVCGRLPKDKNRILVVASAGNTARAFAKVCSENNIPILISIPYDNLDALWFDKPLNDCVKIISSPAGSDYFDAISLAQVAVKSEKFLDEGGAKNVARRDGMGTTLLSAAVEIGSIPDVYVQAIGSGTGGIAAWEAAMRLAEDGSWGENNMQLLLVQNAPFTPMYDAWNADSRNLLPFDDEQARLKAVEINAKVLSNRRPPYPVSGGVYDALKASSGLMEVADNDDIITYSALFEECEGIDINPAAAIALAGLDKAVRSGKVSKDKTIVLNITGGGEKRFKADNQCFYAKPALVASAGDEGVLDKIIALFE
ncbi:MAG: cysteate synthase, partial [Bacteroidales bacterium]|nr:cysteate synthase [Bacteroidales bacterium]